MANGKTGAVISLSWESNIAEVKESLRDGLYNRHREYSLIVERKAKENAPPPPRFSRKLPSGKWSYKLTNINRRSITSSVEMGEGLTIKGAVWTRSSYGGWLETGTRRMPARPYIVPSHLESRKEANRLFSGII